jgi:serine/threonine-protein kinase HipA
VIEVCTEWNGGTYLVGTVRSAARSGAVTFTYDDVWLTRRDAFAIDPTVLPLRPGAYHAESLFAAIRDVGPDRWGRVLIERAVRKRVLPERPFRDLDYVLALDDASRIGALRFRRPGGPFLAESGGRLPPLLRLPQLLQAADAVHGDAETADDLRFLLGQGSPLGGARPKSAVVLPDGGLAIAKFRKPDDMRDIAAGEVLALTLAKAAGIDAAAARLVKVQGSHAAVITRFDRDANGRIPFVSAATLLGVGERDAGSYTAIAEAIRQFGDDVVRDLAELWRRMVFSLLVGNCDDHLRNHGFLMRSPGRWSLSPAYDINPVPAIEQSGGNATSLSDGAGERSVEHALALAPRFGLTAAVARSALHQVADAVSSWRQAGKRLRLPASTLEAYASAFAETKG